MDINVTLFGEMITFAVLVWVMMKYIWPPLIKTLEERQKKIADGLEAAERGQNSLKISQEKSKKQLQETKVIASTILNKANKQANEYIEEGKSEAKKERDKIFTQANMDIETEKNKAESYLKKQTASLVINATEKLLEQKIDDKTQEKLVEQLITKI